MKIGLALYGLGTVGSGLVEVLRRRECAVREAYGIQLGLEHIVVRDASRPRDLELDGTILGTDLGTPIWDPAVSIVVELMGGKSSEWVVSNALCNRKSVVTADKALIAEHGRELEALARANGATLRYEPSVAGAIPILNALRGPLVGNRVRAIAGVLNGTTNYILTRMAGDHLSLEDALAEAQARGYAEADPTADISGLDSARKLVILSRHAFGHWVKLEQVPVKGITDVTPEHLAHAAMHGGTVKLLGRARQLPDGTVEMSVEPSVVPASDPLGQVRNETNAVVLETDLAGPLVFMGAGAGGLPTASAVYADVVDTALQLTSLAPRKG